MKNLLLNIIEDLIRNISGSLGIWARRKYYSTRLNRAGKNLKIDTGVYFTNPSFISIGEGTWIDKNCILIAGPVKGEGIVSKPTDGIKQIRPGELLIGQYSHLGIGTVIQAHGGVLIEDYFTSSAGCKIYSFSNDYNGCRKGTMVVGNTDDKPAYFSKPVIIGYNVWLGLNVSVISSSIGENVFVMPHSVVYKTIDSNKVASGNPAIPVKDRFKTE